MKDLFVVVSARDWAIAEASLFTDDGNENAGVFMCGLAEGASESRLLVRRYLPVSPDLYVHRDNYHLEVSPAFYNRVVDECLGDNLTPVIVHSHPRQDEAWYSRSDDFGEERLVPVLQSLLPETKPASLVVTPRDVTGRTRLRNGFVSLSGLKVLGQKSRILGFADKHRKELPSVYDRQVRFLGVSGQDVLRALKVGVVGVGGIGSLVVEQLARVGVEDLLVIDNDFIEESNLSRMFGSHAKDLGKRKVDVIAKHARALGANKVKPIPDSAIRQRILMFLRDRDVIFSCVDNDRTRAILNRFSYQYLVPVIELGTRLDGRGGLVRGAAGRIVLIGHGLACLRCSHYLNPERIRAESLPEKERNDLAREGYVMGIEEPAPAVISLNTAIAGLGVTAALNIFVNLTGGPQPSSQLYDATTGSVFTAMDVHDKGCDVCDEDVGVKGLGDLQIVSAYE